MKKENAMKDELDKICEILTKKKMKYSLLITITTILLAISILINNNTMFILINVATIGLLMINRSCTFSFIRKNDIGEKAEFIVGILLLIISFLLILFN